MILIAPTAFKSTLTPSEVAHAIESGVRSSRNSESTTLCPLADGGDGTVEAAHLSLGGTIETLTVHSATNKPVQAKWLRFIDRTGTPSALIELANACGIGLESATDLRPMQSHTAGLGQVIISAYNSGIRNLIIGLGGSASTDGGMGALATLGMQFFDQNGKQLSPGGGASLKSIYSCAIDRARFHDCTFTILADVDNPLLGAGGAAAIFAPQKGATQTQIGELERGLEQFADTLEKAYDRRLRHRPGMGAAGGTAFGLCCALGATITSGFEWIADAAQLNEKLQSCSLVITGEGKFDNQSMHGKVIGALAKRCRTYRKPLWIVTAASELTAQDVGVEQLIVPSPSGKLCTVADLSRAVANRLQSKSEPML